MQTTVDDEKLKELVKQALIEILEERQDLLSAPLAEIIEDIALARSIQEGEQSETVDRETIFSVLESRE